MGDNGGLKVSALFTPVQILCGLTSATREECIRSLAKRLEKTGAIADAGSVVSSVMEREQLGSTIVAPGLAIPHARMEGQQSVALAVATSRAGVPFGSGEKAKANLIVLIVTGTQAPGDYLQVLAAVVRAFADTSVIDKVARLDKAEKVWEFFDRGAAMLPEFVTAGDMMAGDFRVLRHTDTLAVAIDFFCRHTVPQVPIVDGDDDFVGVVGEQEILKLSLPEYILWLEDLGPILQFEPFGETLKNEHITRLAEIMSKDFVTVSEEAPAIEVARLLMRGEVSRVFVVREHKLVGIITLSDLLRQVFRG